MREENHAESQCIMKELGLTVQIPTYELLVQCVAVSYYVHWTALRGCD